MTDDPTTDREADAPEPDIPAPHPSPAEDLGEAVKRPPRPSQPEGERQEEPFEDDEA